MKDKIEIIRLLIIAILLWNLGLTIITVATYKAIKDNTMNSLDIIQQVELLAEQNEAN